MAKLSLSQLEQATTVPAGSLHLVEMGDGSGTKTVTQETMVEETGKALKIGNMKELQTENKTSIVAAINEVQQSGGSGGTSVDILDSQEEIEANTEAGKAAGALAVQEMFGALNDKLNGNILTYNESEDAFYIQHGADSVPKKLGKSTPERITVFSGSSKSSNVVDVTQYDGWDAFTVDNFCLNDVSISYEKGSSSSGKNNIIDRYDAEAGKLYLNAARYADGYYYIYYINYSVILLR